MSYGILLANPSPDQDALDVIVLVNAVDATNRVLQTKTERLDVVASGTTFALGGYLTLNETADVSRLELVVQMGARAPKAVRYPTISNVRIVASTIDKGYVKAVEGELANELKSFVLAGANLSVVLFDTAGNIVGGGSGAAFTAFHLERGPSSAPRRGCRRFRWTGEPWHACPFSRGTNQWGRAVLFHLRLGCVGGKLQSNP